MGWADEAIERLKSGQVAKVRLRNQSLTGKVEENELVTLSPLTKPLKVGDVVLVTVKGTISLQMVKDLNNGRFLIGNTRGGNAGWVKIEAIHGIVTRIQPASTPDPIFKKPAVPPSPETALPGPDNE
jgi:hypothetical protein